MRFLSFDYKDVVDKDYIYNPVPGLDRMFSGEGIDGESYRAKRKYQLLLHFGIVVRPERPGETNGIWGREILKYREIKLKKLLKLEEVRRKLSQETLKLLKESVLPALEELKKKVSEVERAMSSLQKRRVEQGEEWRKEE